VNTKRRNDIDWLRAFAILVVFLFHCAVFFSYEDWPAKNNQLSFGMTVFVSVVNQWIMPLFFILSAISSYHALERRSNRTYIAERSKRLAVPLVFGIFAMAPFQVYIERVTHGEFTGSFASFFPHYFDGFYRLGGNFAWMGIHLWYLEMLFIFSIVTLPLFRLLGRETMQSFGSGIAGFFGKPGAIFLFSIPIAVVEMLTNLQPDTIGRRDFGGWSPVVYLVLFVLGYLIAGDQRIRQRIEKERITALLLGAAATAAGYFLLTSGSSSRTLFFSFLRAFNSWCWLMAILGFGSRHLTLRKDFLLYANEAVLPFYILHQTVIVAIGFLIAGWEMGVMSKYIVLATASFMMIFLLYDGVIKRIPILRFLFGMKFR
jgi:peptidoglycan/LPS O-acetylase OafA/YrhL